MEYEETVSKVWMTCNLGRVDKYKEDSPLNVAKRYQDLRRWWN